MQLAMPLEIEVWFFNDKVGTLSLEGGGLGFYYNANWLAMPNARALSHSLPLRAEPYSDGQTRPFFAGLLPEGQMRRLIAQQFQVSRQNDFALLNAIGGDCAGAITFLPKGKNLQPHGSNNIQWLSDQQLVETLDELPHRPMLAGKDGLRLSLAGAQDKLPVVFDGHRIGLPQGGTPSTHILKPPILAVSESVTNEGFCLALAQSVKLPTAEAEIRQTNGRSYLLVKRYDRLSNDTDATARLHQEDFCQALGVIPEMKYQNEGGPDLPKCFDLIRKVTRPSAPQLLHLFDYVVFNSLIGNHDAHAKNFSLLYTNLATQTERTLAPLYDVLCTAIYPNLTQKMAMKLGSKYKFSEVHSRHWEQFADSTGLAKAQTRKRIIALAKKLPAAARALQSTSVFQSNPIVEQIVALIEGRSALTLIRLTENPLKQ